MSIEAGRAKGVQGGGAAPPPDAPVETAQPLQADAIRLARERASANEKTLPPFNPPKRGAGPIAPPPTAPAVESVKPTATEDLISEVFGEPVRVADRPDVVVAGQGEPIPPQDLGQAEVDQMFDILPELTAEDRARMPAASNSDTPARGLLPTITPPKGPKEISGGFGDLGDAEYFPLTGEELRELVLAQFDTLAAQIRNDLRFSMALVYPRIRCTVRIEVEGHAEDNNAGFVIEKVRVPKDGDPGSTLIEVARTRADQVCFVVQSRRQEFTDAGEVDAPPDAIRDELGVTKPRKRMLETPGGGHTFVDVDLPGADVAALTR